MGILEAREAFINREEGILNWDRWEFATNGNHRYSEYISVRIRPTDLNGEYMDAVEYSQEMKALREFCEEHELLLFGYQTNHILTDFAVSTYSSFYIADRMPRGMTARDNGYGPQIDLSARIECPRCGESNDVNAAACLSCEGHLCCTYCGQTGQSWNTRERRGIDNPFVLYENCDGCIGCMSQCPTCETLWRNGLGTSNSNTVECRECNPRFNCSRCGDEQLGEAPVGRLCDVCIANSCADCGNYLDEEGNGEGIEEEGRIICSRCFNALDRNLEVFDDDSEMPATRLAIPTIEGRERIRFCGLEIEGVNVADNAHNILAADFYDAGLSVFNSRRGYHERYEGGFVHVERDSSCDWETVAGPLNMASNQDVRNLNRVIKIIRGRIKDGTVKLSLNCGLHIHVGAEKVGIKQAHNLHLLYTYLEDIMYRLGAAKWPMHRAVVNGDHSYQLSPRANRKIDFINMYMDNRYHGLSFSNYFQKMLNHCQCGAGRFGLFEECTCELTKCTFEFRIFNTTANTRKIHAYTALTQALIAKAFSIREFDFEAMPEMQFNVRNVKDMSSTEQEKLFDEWMPRMKFILEELPLTDDEKLSVLYCVENSELSSIYGYCQELVNLEVVA